jgi:hypothetical protein
MVRYLKWIIIIFGSIGICVATFFFLQNKHDISRAMDYKSKIDYAYLEENCPEASGKYYTPCLTNVFAEYLSDVSFTGTNIGMKMVFNVIDKDKDNVTFFKTELSKDIHYSLNYLEINNLALAHAYKKYFGFDFLYGGFIATLNENYVRGYIFSENIFIGLDGPDGIKKITNEELKKSLSIRLKKIKTNFYRIKLEVETFVESEKIKLTASHK